VFRKFVFRTTNFGIYFIIEFCYLIALYEFMVKTRTSTHADEAPRRPIMEAAPNAVETVRGDMSSMAPLMKMLAEIQRELGDLRRKSRNGSSDNEDSDDGLVSDTLADFSRTFAEDELQSRTHNGLLPAIRHEPRFRRILHYRYYWLHKRSSRYDAEVAGRVAKWSRQLEASLKLRLDDPTLWLCVSSYAPSSKPPTRM
jgi:hypothetical protein